MKKFFVFILFLFFTIKTTSKLYCQNVSFDDVKQYYEIMVETPNLENLRTFSTSLDLYSQSKEYASLKKHLDYQNSFSELNKSTKRILNTFSNPWEKKKSADYEIVSTKLISEKIYYFVTARSIYVTRKIILYRALVIISCLTCIFIIVFFLFIWKYKKEKQENLIFSKAIITGQESERKRISEELHDTLAQNLKVQKLEILSIIDKNRENLNIEEDLKQILQKSKSNITEIRSICQKLFPPDFENQKLEWIIAELCENTRNNTGIICTYFVDSESPFLQFKTDEKLNFLRIIQEAVNNAINHSQCTKIQIFITKKELIISDDGRGFDYQRKMAENKTHFGLRSIKERALLLNLTFKITSNEKGTSITLTTK